MTSPADVQMGYVFTILSGYTAWYTVQHPHGTVAPFAEGQTVVATEGGYTPLLGCMDGIGGVRIVCAMVGTGEVSGLVPVRFLKRARVKA